MIENRLSVLLGERRMNIRTFAQGAGINYGSAHSMYHGKTTRWDSDILVAVCKFLDIQVGDLLVYRPDEPQEGS